MWHRTEGCSVRAETVSQMQRAAAGAYVTGVRRFASFDLTMHDVDVAAAAVNHGFVSDELGILRRVVTDAPVAMALFDAKMRYLAASAIWCDGCGVPRESLLGRVTYDVTPTAERFKAVYDRCLLRAAEGSRGGSAPSHAARGSLGAVGVATWHQCRQHRRPHRPRHQHHSAARRAHRTRRAQSSARVALDASSAGTWTLNVRTGEVAWDERSYEMFGFRLASASHIDQVLGTMSEGSARIVASLAALEHWPPQSATGARKSGSGERTVRRDGSTRAAGLSATSTAGSRPGRHQSRHHGPQAGGARCAGGEQQARLALEAASAFAWSWDVDNP